MKTYPWKVILAATGLLLLPLTSHAAITIAYYDFATNTSVTTTGANNTATTVTGANWTGSAPNNGRSTGNGPDGNAGHYFGRGPKDTAATSYIQFGVTATNFTTLDLSSLSFDYWTASIATTGTPSFTFEVRSSLDTYAAAIPGTYSLNPIIKVNDGQFQTASFDLTGSSFQDLATITFRLYVTGSAAANTNDIVRFDDIQLQVIPEPTTALLGSLGLLALLRRRRA